MHSSAREALTRAHARQGFNHLRLQAAPAMPREQRASRREFNTGGDVNPLQSAVGAEKPAAGSSSKGSGSFRFWHDERRFKGPGSVCVVQEALYASGGVRTGGYPKAAPIPGPLGYQRPNDWDLLWTPARLALKHAPCIKPGQLICSSPGMMSLSRKRKLPVTLHTALGRAAWAVTPRSFVLPGELPALRAHMASREAAGAGDELWILKTAQHLGKGLNLLPAKHICAEAEKMHVCVEGNKVSSKPYVLAQQYIENPLLIEGRKFGIRVWVLVLGPNPLRAYLHSNGLVLFATSEYDGSSTRDAAGGVALGHVTNYAQNVDGTVWDITQLKTHLGDAVFMKLWDRIAHKSALMCSAALSHMRAEHSALHMPPESAFELLGLDFLVDTEYQPWLLEVNGTPSLAVDHALPHVEQIIHTQKGGMVRDMFQLLDVRNRFKARYEAMRLAAKQVVRRVAQPGPVGGSQQQSFDDDVLEDEELDGDAGAAPAPGKPITYVLPKALRDLLCPRSDAAIKARVASELQLRGDFMPLMSLFPVPPALVQGASAAGGEGGSAAVAAGELEAEDQDSSMMQVEQPQQAEVQAGPEGSPSSSSAEAMDHTMSIDDLLASANLTSRVPWTQRDIVLHQAMLQHRVPD